MSLLLFQHTSDLLKRGRKTQTARLPKSGEYFDEARQAVCHASGRIKFAVGRTYPAMSEYRGKAQARLRITAIEKRDVRDYTDLDAQREGFDSLLGFWMVWTQMHDKHSYTVLTSYIEWQGDNIKNINMSQRTHEYLTAKSKKAENYIAWVYRFEVVK